MKRNMAKKFGYFSVCVGGGRGGIQRKSNHYFFTFQVFILCGGWVGSAVQEKVLKIIDFFGHLHLLMIDERWCVIPSQHYTCC